MKYLFIVLSLYLSMWLLKIFIDKAFDEAKLDEVEDKDDIVEQATKESEDETEN